MKVEVQESDVIHIPRASQIQNYSAKQSAQVKTSDNVFTPAETTLVKPAEEKVDYFIYPGNKVNNIQYKPGPVWNNEAGTERSSEIRFIPQKMIRTEMTWTLFIGFVSVLLLLVLKLYYSKFLNQVISSSINFQVADKLLREKNIIIKRAFLLLNVNYLLVFSLFLLLVAELFGVTPDNKFILNYILIAGIIAVYLIIKLIVNYVVAILFESGPVINQQIHNSFLVNKNLGLFLLPLVFAAIYSTPVIAKILLFIGIGLILIALIIKVFRGFQIILRNDILFFYAILYLCTLELLPLLLGIKFIM